MIEGIVHLNITLKLVYLDVTVEPYLSVWLSEASFIRMVQWSIVYLDGTVEYCLSGW
jgi:hypothetical protein